MNPAVVVRERRQVRLRRRQLLAERRATDERRLDRGAPGGAVAGEPPREG